MSNKKEPRISSGTRIQTFLLDKPMWVFWVIYTVIGALTFGVFYSLMYLLMLEWWGAVISVLAIGIFWGTIAYIKMAPLRNTEPD